LNDNKDETPLPSRRPYLLRAIWQWCMDAGLTPQLLVQAGGAGVDVPTEFVQNGAIVLNVHDRAVRSLDMGNEFISFSARFSGRARNVVVPVEAVLAIYARENGQGLFFEPPELETAHEGAREEGTGEDAAPARVPDEDHPPRGKPHLKLV
jgi:stringent starvation protein B